MIKTIMKTVTNIDYRKFGLPFMVVAILVALFFIAPSSPAPVNAQAATTVTGWAWSDNVGWIQFDHGRTPVTVDGTTGNLSGYAWANPRDTVALTNNIGWINFNPSGPYPSDDTNPAGNSPHGVRLEADGRVTGWARAVSQIGLNPSDGWDGWIRFDHSKANPVRVDLVTGRADGFAWGSTVIGWVDMSPAFLGSIPPCNPATQNCNPDCNPQTENCGGVCDPDVDVCFPCDNCGGPTSFDVTIRVVGAGKVEDQNGTTLCVSTLGNVTNCILSNINGVTLNAIPDPVDSNGAFNWDGACSSVADNTNPCVINSDPATDAIVTFGGSGIPTDLFDLGECIPTNDLCNLVIDCDNTVCDNVPIYSNAVKVFNNVGEELTWQVESINPPTLPNDERIISIVFCDLVTDTTTCSSPGPKDDDFYIKAKLIQRGSNNHTQRLDVTGSLSSDPSINEKEEVRLQYIDTGTGVGK